MAHILLVFTVVLSVYASNKTDTIICSKVLINSKILVINI